MVNQMKTNIFQVVMMSLLVFSACGKEEKRETTSEVGPPKPGGGSTGTGNANNGKSADGKVGSLGPGSSGATGSGKGSASTGSSDNKLGLEGIWMSPCFRDKNGSTTSADYYNFRADGFVTQVIIFFESDKCAPNTELFAVAPIGSYTLGESEEGLSPLDIQITKQLVVLYDPRLVEEFNKLEYYGYSDWVLNETKDVMGRTDPNGKVVESNFFYNNVKIENDQLLMTEFSTDPSDRSEEIISQVTYTRRQTNLLNKMKTVLDEGKIRAL